MSVKEESTPDVPTTEMQQLLLRAQDGDLTCINELRSLLTSRPDLWEKVGNLAGHAEQTMLRLFAGTNYYAMEAARMKLADLKAELAGPSPTSLEKLLIDRIGVSWLQVHQLDLQAATPIASSNSPQAVWAQKKLDSAHRRYLLAIKQLATVRKLLRPDLPPIQINAFAALKPTGKARQGKVALSLLSSHEGKEDHDDA